MVLDGECYIVICSSFYLEILQYIEDNKLCDEKRLINLYAYDKDYGRFIEN